jgi:adhesin HecA-like repeat protein
MIKLSFSTLMRIATLMAVCPLVGCGGASSTVDPLVPTRVIAFGDALSDTSPDPALVLPNGSGEFTVQTGETDNTLAGRLAAKYGIVLNNGSTSSGGYSYADGTLNSGKVSDVGNQITTYLGHVGNSIGAKDLIIITVGSQDIYYAAKNNNPNGVVSAATNLTSQIQRLTNAGAKYVLVVLPINMARTPWGLSGADATSSVIQGLSYDTGNQCLSFSCQLIIKLNSAYPATTSHQPILLADLMSYSNLFTGTTTTGSSNTYLSYGVTNPNTGACGLVKNILFGGCSTGEPLLDPNYATFVFADNLNLTPFANRLMADYIYNYNFYRAGWR